MDYENKPYISDTKAKNIIQEIIDEKNVTVIRRLPQKELLILLNRLKDYKLSISQLSRITGISRQIIRKA